MAQDLAADGGKVDDDTRIDLSRQENFSRLTLVELRSPKNLLTC